jgi:hypothetical protein
MRRDALLNMYIVNELLWSLRPDAACWCKLGFGHGSQLKWGIIRPTFSGGPAEPMLFDLFAHSFPSRRFNANKPTRHHGHPPNRQFPSPRDTLHRLDFIRESPVAGSYRTHFCDQSRNNFRRIGSKSFHNNFRSTIVLSISRCKMLVVIIPDFQRKTSGIWLVFSCGFHSTSSDGPHSSSLPFFWWPEIWLGMMDLMCSRRVSQER